MGGKLVNDAESAGDDNSDRALRFLHGYAFPAWIVEPQHRLIFSGALGMGYQWLRFGDQRGIGYLTCHPFWFQRSDSGRRWLLSGRGIFPQFFGGKAVL